jgi:hypothetical protein
MQSKALLYIKKGTFNAALTLYTDTIIGHE